MACAAFADRWFLLTSVRSQRTARAAHCYSLDKHSREHAEAVCREVARVETASEKEMPDRGGAKRVQRWRVVELARLDDEADYQCHRGPDRGANTGHERGDPPRHHHRPEQVTEHVARGAAQRCPVPVDGEADRNRRDGDGDI